jgi:probable phosphoglycerate mutase
MTDVLVVRHGQSEWNAKGRWQGQEDPPLSPLGRLQAAHAAGRLDGVEAVVCSDLVRAHRTAEILAEALGVAEVRVDPNFRERRAGRWQGLTRVEIEERWPGYLASGRRPEGWEPDAALASRVESGLARVAAEHPQRRVLVVSHGGVIYQLERQANVDAGRVPNLGGRWLHREGGTFRLGERAVLVDEDELTVPAQL